MQFLLDTFRVNWETQYNFQISWENSNVIFLEWFVALKNLVLYNYDWHHPFLPYSFTALYVSSKRFGVTDFYMHMIAYICEGPSSVLR